MNRPANEQRAGILEALRDASPGGLPVTELWRRGHKDVHAHITTLQGDGHDIQQGKFTDPVHGETWGWALA